MIFLDLGGSRRRDYATELLRLTVVPENNGLMLTPVMAGSICQCEPRCWRDASWAAITRHGIVSPRRSSPVRGVAPTTTPNHRPRISQPSIQTSTP